ncbi:MAG: ComEC/Rec2 family competence protein [Phormidesmis sp. CAN_BIN36]|nr:ComEC/Rec2 family competence protein [Phormidesmis sp. CAN_BIN36]
MNLTSGVILSLAYILGLLSTGVAWGGIVILVLGCGAAIALPKLWKGQFSSRIWIAAGVVGLVASLYFQIRVPQPGVSDISRLIAIESGTNQQQVTVSGQVMELPRLNRSGKSQLWLAVSRVDGATQSETLKPDQVRGKLYVTVPLLQATGVTPGQKIAIAGILYKPKPATNPGGFNFQAYLAQDGCFAGLRGQTIELLHPSDRAWGWWMIRQKIIRSQIDWLGSPEGQLVSSMVLGSRVVDLPFDVKDQFTRIGLSHALAASGFQVSLILGVILELMKRFSTRLQAGVGAVSLLIFLGLTGLEPSVMRAVIMGIGLLVGLLMKRNVKPLGGLLLTAIMLLIINPMWIWDLGFQLSFLATMGLQITAPTLAKQLDWLPNIFASILAIPIAAYIWTLPLQLYAFGVLSPYSIPVNVIVTPLISIISIGGVISAFLALIAPIAGSASAWLLHYPTYGLLIIIDLFCKLPGNSIAVGTISAFSAVILYALICLPWLRPKVQPYSWLIGLVAIALVFIPAWYVKANSLQLTMLATLRDPILVIQDHGQITLVNSGDESTASSTVLPFLQKEGINQLDWAIATLTTKTTNAGWSTLLARTPAKSFYQLASLTAAETATIAQTVQTHQGRYLPFEIGQTMQMRSTSVQLVSTEPGIVRFQIGEQHWLWLKDTPKQQQTDLLSNPALDNNQVLWWSGKALKTDLIDRIKPEVAIAYSNRVDLETVAQLQSRGTQFYSMGQDGSIRWTPQTRFEKALESSEKNARSI